MFLLQLPEFFFRQQFALFQGSLTWIDGHVRFEIENALEFAQGHIEEVTDAARQSFEEPNMRARTRQLDMTQPFTADFRKSHFDTALVANNAAVLHALVLAAKTLPVGNWTEDAGTE